jgi:hypothetical protein
MRFTTDDGEFGFIVMPVGGRGMFRFQIVLQGSVIGDEEPCFLTTAMKQLRSLPRFDEEAFRPGLAEVAAIASRLRVDEDRHDASAISLAESLDRWHVFGYVSGGNVVLLAQEDGSEPNSVLASVVELQTFEQIMDVVIACWMNGGGKGAE